MSTQDTGGSAFPEVFTDIKGERGEYHSDTYSAGGMSLLDYFAAKAMQARMSDYQSLQSLKAAAAADGRSFADELSRQSYDMAAAMLKARKS